MKAALGLVALGVAWLGFLPRHTFHAHMTAHILVVAIAPPLLALAIAGRKWDPVSRTPSLFSPLLASLVELCVVWIWHTPALHNAARTSMGALVLEQTCFLLSGLYLWMSVFGGNADWMRGRRGEGIVALLLTAMHMTLLGALLALSPRPLYVHPHELPPAWSPLDDQHLGGAIMILVGGVSYLAGGLWLSLGILDQRRGLYR